jgi:hypothetical protein
MLTQYHPDSSRYLLVDSSYRNRSEFPSPADFDIPLPNSTNPGDPIFDGYPLEFGYFGPCSASTSVGGNILQLSGKASNTSNYYNGMIIIDETISPTAFTTVVSYDATTASFGFAKACVTTGFSGNFGNPGNLYSIRRALPVLKGTYCTTPSQKHFFLSNSGIKAVKVTPFYAKIFGDFKRMNISLVNQYGNGGGYGASCVGIVNSYDGNIANVLTTNFSIESARIWKPVSSFIYGLCKMETSLVSGTPEWYFFSTVYGLSGWTKPRPVPPSLLEWFSYTQKMFFIGKNFTVKKWYPNTLYFIGDIVYFTNVYYIVYDAPPSGGYSGNTALPYVGSPLGVNDNQLKLNVLDGLRASSGRGFGPSMTRKWLPNTLFFEGTFVTWQGNTYSVYTTGYSGNSPPTSTALYTPLINGSAFFMYVTNTNNMPVTYILLSSYLINSTVILDDQPFTINAIDWEANLAVNKEQIIYEQSIDSFFISRNSGVLGTTAPTTPEEQTSGTVVLAPYVYTDPYKGCLFKITNVENSSSVKTKVMYSRIKSYNPYTRIVTLESDIPSPSEFGNYEIIQFSRNNFFPLQYTVNPFVNRIQSPALLYDIQLTSLIVPNLPLFTTEFQNILTSSQIVQYDSYPRVNTFPYIIVTLRNSRNKTTADPKCSTNPSEYSATFRVPVTDNNPVLSAPFIRLYCGETKTMYLNNNDNLHLTVTSPDGKVLVYANPDFIDGFYDLLSIGIVPPDTVSYTTGYYEGFGVGIVDGPVLPIPPSKNGQISAVFQIMPKVAIE